MPTLHHYDYIFAITTLFTFLDAWNIGANDVANSFATSVSSRSLTLKQAMGLASVCELLGSIAVGSRVADTIRTRIVDPHVYDDAPAVLLLAMTATASVGITKVNWGWRGVSQVFAAWVIAPGLAGILGGALFLFTKMTVLNKQTAVRRAFFSIPFYTFTTLAAITMLVVWKGIQNVSPQSHEVIISIFVVAGGGVLVQAYFVLPYLWVRIIREDWTLQWWHYFHGPWLLRKSPPPPTPIGAVKPRIKDYYRGHLTAEELHYVRASETLLQSVQTWNGEQPPEDNDDDPILPPPAQTLPPSPKASRHRKNSTDTEYELIPPRPTGPWNSWSVVAWRLNRFLLRGIEKDVVSMQKRNAVLKWDLADMHSRAEHFDNRAEYMYSSLQIITAAAASFTHGANDVANAITPFTTAYEVWSTGEIAEEIDVPIWVLCFGGGAIVLGLLTFGYHVMRTLGNRLTLISPSRGFCMEMASALTVLLATRLRLPISTTQCITGATVGVGLANGDWRCINPRLVLWIYFGWLITLPVTGLVSGCLMATILNAPRWQTTP